MSLNLLKPKMRTYFYRRSVLDPAAYWMFVYPAVPGKVLTLISIVNSAKRVVPVVPTSKKRFLSKAKRTMIIVDLPMAIVFFS